MSEIFADLTPVFDSFFYVLNRMMGFRFSVWGIDMNVGAFLLGIVVTGAALRFLMSIMGIEVWLDAEHK